MVIGLAKNGSYAMTVWVKCVDVSPFGEEGRLLPNDGEHISR